MKKAIIFLALAFLLALPLVSAGNLIYNETFNDTRDLFSNTCTVKNQSVVCADGQNFGLIFQGINLTSNNYPYTYELNNFSWTGGGSTLRPRWTSKNTTAGFSYRDQIRGGTDLKIESLDDGACDGVNVLFSSSLTNLNLKLTWYPNKTIQVFVNDTLAAVKSQCPTIVYDPTFFQLYANLGTVSFNWIAHYNGTNSTTPSAPAPDTFTITARNVYDGAVINNFGLRISNSTMNRSNWTTSGSLVYTDIINGLYTINITSNETGGYFETKYIDYNVTNDMIANLTQSYLNLYVSDTLTGTGLSSFTVVTNYSTYQAENGYILLTSKNGSNHILNITSSKYPLLQTTYSISSLENKTIYLNDSPFFNFYLRREYDNSVFDVNSTNSTRLTIYCPLKNIVIWFKNSSYSSTYENRSIDCIYNMLKMDISYPSSSYFRTLLPATYQTNVTWWLLDLNKDIGVQKILSLVDLSGEWSSGYVTVTNGVGTSNKNIIQQYFDVSNSVTLYLLKDSIYNLYLTNSLQTITRGVGTITADAAGTITLTFPNIDLLPQQGILEKNLSWSYTCPFSQCEYNTSDSVIKLTYLDSTHNTSLLTWKIYNTTNSSKWILMNEFSSSSSQTTFTFTPAIDNVTYTGVLSIQNSLTTIIFNETKTFGIIRQQAMTGYTPEEETTLYKWAAIIFVVLVGLAFSAYNAGIGLTTAFIFVCIFQWMGWIGLNAFEIGLMGFAAIGGYVFEYVGRGK